MNNDALLSDASIYISGKKEIIIYHVILPIDKIQVSLGNDFVFERGCHFNDLMCDATPTRLLSRHLDSTFFRDVPT